MRGKVLHIPVCKLFAGITPAYAGKSFVFRAVTLNIRDHPRVCGEKPDILFALFFT